MSQRRERRPEDQLQDAVTAACGALPGVVLFDMRHVGKFAKVLRDGYGPPVQVGFRGQPDMLVLVEGRALGVELKSAAGRVSPDQARVHAAWRLSGVPVVVARSVAEVVAAIESRRQA